MNRRNFVVGLGTVATISGVASVTAASFSSSVTPTTNFQIIPEDRNLTVRRLQDEVDYGTLSSGNKSWNDSEITDFGNVTGEINNSVVAYVNTSENGQMGAQLAFNNTNTTTYSEYTYDATDDQNKFGFFEVANLGETDEDVSITLGFSNNVGSETGDVLTESEVADLFTFQDEDGNAISPNSSDPNTPAGSVVIPSGSVHIVGLYIDISANVYDTIQEAAGGAFAETDSNIKLLDNITIGTDF